MRDIVKRDGDFVHRGKDRSGWDKTSRSATDYLMRGFYVPESMEGRIREIHTLCRNRASNLSPKPVTIRFGKKVDTAVTNGINVYISSSIFDESKTFSEKSDIMLGLTTHELAHVMHTNFHDSKLLTPFEKTIHNIIEDERIEKLIGEEYPGYAHSLATVKHYFFDEKYLIEKAASKDKEDSVKGLSKSAVEDLSDILDVDSEKRRESMEIFDLFFKLVRYPKFLDEDKMGFHESAMDQIYDALTPYPDTSYKTVVAAKKVAKIIDAEMADKTGMSKEERDKIGSEIASMMGDLMSDNDDSVSKPDAPKEEGKAIEGINFDETYIEDKENRAIFRNGKSQKDNYGSFLKDVKGDSRRLANTMFIKTFNERKLLKGLRNGNLDDTKIVDLAHGVKTCYTASTEKISKKMNIVMLIDESGSMGGSKSSDAARAAIMIKEAFALFPIGDLFIYGFTGDYEHSYNHIIRYKEPGFEVPFGLGDVRGRCQNRDGHCIRSVAKRVRSLSREPMIFFMISDGEPASSDYVGARAIKDTREAVVSITKMNFFPIQIGIGSGINLEIQKKMFDDCIHYSSSKEMVDQLRKLLLRKAHKFVGI